MLIAIDGPAASGKGSIARRLGAYFSLPYLDTGILYRAVAYDMIRQNVSLDDIPIAQKTAEELCLEDLMAHDLSDLRGRLMGESASVIAVYPEVRLALLKKQHLFAARPEGAILDGRDIGTAICPNAQVKFFVTARLEVRAKRRTLELQSRGEIITFEDILEDLRQRDLRDSMRKTAPLQCPADAFILENSNLSEEEAFSIAREHTETLIYKPKIPRISLYS
jgi:cytidylate kinase